MALSQREKALVAVPVVLATLFGFYRWVHEPLLARRAEAAELNTKSQNDLKAQQSKLAREGDLKARLAAVTAREQTVDAWVPGKNSAALFIWYLSQSEVRSGVKIKELKVGDRKEVQATPQDSQAAPKGQQAPGTAAVPTLTVVQIDLKLDGHFAEHSLFIQELEQTPLFLNTDSLELSKESKSPVEQVGKLVAEGSSFKAAKILQASPSLSGTYQIKLYFKSSKVGPSTDPMHFTEQTGRPDPFAMDGVDEFIQALQDYYTGVRKPGDPDSANVDSGPANRPGMFPSQMG